MTPFRIYLFLLSFMLWQQNAVAQEWIRQHPFPIINFLQDIIMDENGNGWAVGFDKTVLRTYNFGQVWENRSIDENSPVLGVNDNLDQVFFLSDPNGEGILVSTLGYTVLRTTDDANNWEVVLEGRNINENFKAFASLGNSSTIVAIGKELYTSADQGSSWDTIALPDVQYQKKGFFLDEQNWWVVEFTINGKFFKTTDGGQSWTQPSSQTFSFVKNIHFFNQQEGILVDNNGLYETSDGGATWTQSLALTSTKDLYVQDQNTFFIIRNTGALYTTDGGNTWIESSGFNYGQLQACTALPDGQLWIAGEYSSIYYSDDAMNWTDQIGGVKAFLEDIFFTDENSGFAWGSGGQLLRTSDGGAIWEDVSTGLLPLSELILRASYTDASGKIILVDNSGRIILSEDHGTSWQITDTLTSFNSYNQIVAAEGGALFLTSNQGKLWTSTNGGYDWTELNQIGNSVKDIHFNTATSGWACGNNGQLYHTTDAGLSWTTVDLNTTKDLNNIEFINELKGFVFPWQISSGDVIWVTEDGGQTWETAPAPQIGYAYDLKFSDENHGWVAGGIPFGKIYATTDGGQTWTLTHAEGPQLHALACPLPGELAWAAGFGGQILKWISCEAVNGSPMLTQISANTSSFCMGDTITLSLSFSNVDIFQWSFPADWVLLGNENSASVDVIVGMESGVITATGQNACGEEDSVDSELFEPLAAPNPPTLIFDNNTLHAQADATSYIWYLNGMEIPGENGATLVPTENGTYTVAAVNSNGCTSAPSNAVEVTTVSTYSLSANTQPLHITPNPATGSFTISHLPQGKQATLLLYNTYGKTVFKREFLTNGSALLVEWQDYKPGLYYLRLETAGQVYAGKIVFQ